MLIIGANNEITLTRGDTLTLTVSMTKDGQTYTPQAGDVIRFAVSVNYLGAPGYELIYSDTIPNDTLTITIPATETKKWNYKTYNYDVEITHSDGSIDTFISSQLTITGEVK